MVRALLDEGHEVVVLDDLSTGHRRLVSEGASFVDGDVGNVPDVTALLRDQRIDAVFHFAARSRVEESVREPRLYFQGTLAKSLALLEAVLDAGVGTFVFSSTAAVYGTPEKTPIEEDHPLRPVNPYGDAKLAIERALEAYGRAYGLKWPELTPRRGSVKSTSRRPIFCPSCSTWRAASVRRSRSTATHGPRPTARVFAITCTFAISQRLTSRPCGISRRGGRAVRSTSERAEGIRFARWSTSLVR
jgi:hypothetical protein